MSSDKWMIAYLIVGIITAIGVIAEWREDPEWEGHWSDWLATLCPPMVLLWPFMLPDVLVHQWRRHSPPAG